MADGAQEEFSIHWISDVVDTVAARDVDEYLISTGKSPSGKIHIGFVRELIIADVIKRELQKQGKKARSMFVVDDYDPIRSFPSGISLSIDEWLGVPYSAIPDEFGCCESFGAHYANQLIETFSDFGLDPEIVWTSKLYQTTEMKDAVRTCLKETSTIRKIMIDYVAKDFSDSQREEYIESMKTWYPGSVICSGCGRLQAGQKGSIVPNRILDYNHETDEVTYKCPNCGHEETAKLDEVQVKLTWRVDWPAKWFVLDVTCEPAGKDHSVKGGSYDTGLEVSRQVFGWDGPVKVPYEWVMIGGRDMATSEGIVFTPKEWLSIADASLYRYLMLKTDRNRTVNIQPARIPDLMDEYDRFERTFYGVESVDESSSELAKILYPLTEARPVSPEYIPKVPYKFAAVMSQLEPVLGHELIVQRSIDVIKKQLDLESVPDGTVELIQPRLKRANNWALEYGPEHERVKISDTVPESIITTLTTNDKEFLTKLLGSLKGKELDDEQIQTLVFESARETELKVRRAFTVLYRILLSRKSGPRIGPLINMLGSDWVVERIEYVL